MSFWYAMVMHKAQSFEPLQTAIFIMPSTERDPKLPPNGRLLGQIRLTRADAIDEAIDFLRAERAASEFEGIKV